MITLYKTESCPYCKDAEEFLDQMKVQYEKVDIFQDEEAAAEMAQKSGQMGVPVIDIDGEIVVGFEKEKILELLRKS